MRAVLPVLVAAIAPTGALRLVAPRPTMARASPATGRATALFMEAEPPTLEEDPVAEEEGEAEAVEVIEPPTAPAGWEAVPELWPADKQADIRIEGGQTLKTFKMPDHAERVQYILTTPSGRPIKAKVELWIGPIRCVHELIYDTMHGGEFPLKGTLQFKKLSPVLKISTNDNFEFPLVCGVFVPSPDESKKIGGICKDMFNTAPMKETVQGGSTWDAKGGAIRTFDIDPTWEKTQIMVSSGDVGKKSFKTNIEVLQGPNNAKQHLNLRCGGSTQPFHCVIDTPGPGWMIRCNSKKFIEDGKFQIAVAPYGELVPYVPEVKMSGF